MNKRKRRQQKRVNDKRPFAQMSRIQPQAAGADIGAHEIVMCVAATDEQVQQVRTFGTYTADLVAIGDWLKECQVKSVAMESTGVYWIPLFEYLERIEIECCLISARAIKRVPGRKSDVLDSQWIQTLHSYGLLQASFRPEADLVALRTLLRHRAQLIQHRSPHILHMQKAMIQMNLQLGQVLSDITGETGQRIIRAIIAGERNPDKLAAMRNYRVRKDEVEITLALTGTWREEHLFVLAQAMALYDAYTAQIEACDREIEKQFSLIKPTWDIAPEQEADIMDKHLAQIEKHSKNAPRGVQTRAHIKRITGIDLVAVPGISASLAQTILSEIGTDMSKFPSVKHFSSWLGLAPKNDISGGKVLRRRTLKTKNPAALAFRLAARSLMRSNTEFGAFYRRLKSRLGPAQALVATAHKLAKVVYFMLKNREEYRPMSAGDYEQKFHEKRMRYLKRKVAKLGYELTPIS